VGADGVVVGRELREAGVEVELADRDWLIPVVTLADTPRTVDRLVETLVAAVGRHAGRPRPPVVAASWSVQPEIVLPPREAFFAPTTTLGVREAVGRVSAELVAPYPPGVPVLAPGERITAGAVDSLLAAAQAGTRIAYAADPTMATLRVVA
jgi:lysine decarboxylase